MLFALIFTQVFYFILGCDLALYHTPIIIPDFGAFCDQCYEIEFTETDIVISIHHTKLFTFIFLIFLLCERSMRLNNYFLSDGTKYVQLKLLIFY